MDFFKDLFQVELLDYLIRTKSTGCPEKLANRLGVSQRSTERLVSTIREMGFPIAYDARRETYYYTDEVKISFEVMVGRDTLLKIRGGKDKSVNTKIITANFWR